MLVLYSQYDLCEHLLHSLVRFEGYVRHTSIQRQRKEIQNEIGRPEVAPSLVCKNLAHVLYLTFSVPGKHCSSVP